VVKLTTPSTAGTWVRFSPANFSSAPARTGGAADDLVSEGIKQTISGEGGGRGPVRRGGVEDPPASESLRSDDA
jgi:hypothetical protein